MSDETNEVLDINDPAWSEVYEGDPEGDYNAFIVIPDGVHVAQLQFQEGKTCYGKPDDDKKADKERTMLIAPLNVVIQEDGTTYNNSRIMDWPTSLISFRSGTSPIGDICRVNKTPHQVGLTFDAFKKHVDNVILGEPLLRIKTEWQGDCEHCRKAYAAENPEGLGFKALKRASNEAGHITALDGMKSWPEDEKGGFKSEIKCPVCNEDIQARPKIKKYLSLKP